MKTYTVHVALGEAGASQVLLGAGLTASAAKNAARKSLTPLAQVVTARLEAATPPMAVFAVLSSDEGEEGHYFLDRVSTTEPAAAAHQLVRRLQVHAR